MTGVRLIRATIPSINVDWRTAAKAAIHRVTER